MSREPNNRMGRRELLKGLGGAAAGLPLTAAQAGPAGKGTRRVGFLMTSEFDKELRVKAVEQGLERLGWTAGRNICFEWRWAAGDPGREDAYARELAPMGCRVLVAQ